MDQEPKPRLRRRSIQRSVSSSATARMVLGSLGVQGLIIVSGILAARLLGPTDRGYLAFLVLTPQILATVGGLGLPQALTYWTARDPEALADVIHAIAPTYLIQVVGLTLINVIVLASYAGSASTEFLLASVILLVATPSILTAQYAVAIAQGRQLFILASVIFLLAPTFYVAGIIALAVSDQAHLATIAAAWSLSYLVAALLSFALVVHAWPARSAVPSTVRLRNLLGFGLRALPSLASPLQTLRLDQVAVWLLLGPLALGLYVVALAFTNLPLLLATFMGLTISGKVAAEHDVHAASRSLAGMVAAVAAVSLTLAAVVAIAAPGLISLIFGPEFAGAAGAARILIVGAVAASVQRTIGDGLRAMGDPAASTLAAVISWIALVPGILILPPVLGLEGVAIAMAACHTAGLTAVALRWFRRRRAERVASHAPVRPSSPEGQSQESGGEQLTDPGPIYPTGQE